MARIRRDKRVRKKENISQIVLRVTDELHSTFNAIGIVVDEDINTEIESRLFQIDIESLVVNLLTNAYTACRQIKKNRRITVSLQKRKQGIRKGFSLRISDSGPGVNEKLRSIIWEPAFSTKSTKQGALEEGTGMGLAIVDGIVDEMNGIRKVDADPKLGGARFEIWLPILK